MIPAAKPDRATREDWEVDFALFEEVDSQIVPLDGAASPWMHGLVSGAALGPLIAALAEKFYPDPGKLTTRITLNLLRPVPMAPLQVRWEMLRQGRKQDAFQILLRAGDKPVAAASVLRLGYADDPAVSAEREAAAQGFEPPPGGSFGRKLGLKSDMLDWVESRSIATNDFGPGISEAWLRYRGTVFAGEPFTPLMRAALFADFGNGLAPIVDPRTHTYLNADLSLHISRLPAGEWIRVRARTIGGGNGLAMVGTELGDAAGPIGWAHQSLLVERRGT